MIMLGNPGIGACKGFVSNVQSVGAETAALMRITSFQWH